MSENQDQPVESVTVEPSADVKAMQRFRIHLFWLPNCLMLPTTVMLYASNLALALVSGGVNTFAYDEGARHFLPLYTATMHLTVYGSLAWLAAFLYFAYEVLFRRRWLWRDFFLLVGGVFSNFVVFYMCCPLSVVSDFFIASPP